MTRTQIQLPDDVYDRARKVCESREISMAELARRGFEYMLSIYAPAPATGDDWQPPKPRNLGWKGLNHGEIKTEAQMTSAEARLTRRHRK